MLSIGSTKLALISSYGTKWPLHIHANMSLQIERRWGNCHLLVLIIASYKTTLKMLEGELGCLVSGTHIDTTLWRLFVTKVTAVMNFIFVGYPAFPQEPHLGNNGSWHRKPYCKPIVVLDTEKSTSKDVVFLFDIFKADILEILRSWTGNLHFFEFRSMHLQMVMIGSLGDYWALWFQLEGMKLVCL